MILLPSVILTLINNGNNNETLLTLIKCKISLYHKYMSEHLDTIRALSISEPPRMIL
jgi:hypothetical protein